MSQFDPKQPKSLAGDLAFARGADYAASDTVNIVMAEAIGIHAVVQGAGAYRVRLRGAAGTLPATAPARPLTGMAGAST